MSSILFKALLLTKGQGEDDQKNPLTLTANTAGSTVKLTQTGSPTVSGLQYRRNKSGSWSTYSIGTTITLENEGDYVQFQNTEETLSTSTSNYVKFVMIGFIAGSGNIQSMVNWIENAPAYCYNHMFSGCTSLTEAPALPATTLASNCYQYMFNGCSNLTTAPELPATTLASNCYRDMFRGCSNLTSAPELPVTTLASNCYDCMFVECRSLTSAPELPATTLAFECYSHMFYGCTNLTSAPELPATTLAGRCYINMFYGCTKLNYIKVAFTSWNSGCTDNWVYRVASTGTFVKPEQLPETRGTSKIPSNWTVEIADSDSEFIEINDQSISWNPNNTTIQLVGDNVETWTATNLPAGLTLNSSTGEITGTPTVNDGTYTFTVIGTNPNGYTAQATITITINKLTAGNQVISQYYDDPVNYSIKYSISSSSLNPTFTIVEGSLPDGLTLDQNTGVISGTATTSFEGAVTIQISADGCESVTFTVSINLHTQNKPLTLTANTAGSTVKLTQTGSPTVSGLQYRTSSNNTWTTYTIGTTITLENKGDYVQFQNTASLLSTASESRVQFVMTGSISGSGNMQSMLNWIDSVQNYCYNHMFYNCTSLTTAPELPATTLASNCYFRMFYNCTSLTTAPELPATTLAFECYADMFNGCTSLTAAPELPATTLADHCYAGMLNGCTSLTAAPELPATTLAVRCYFYMFYNCTSLTAAPELPATTLADHCYSNMFGNCSNLTKAPELPATTLVNTCYQYMFNGCSNLNYIKVAFTSWNLSHTRNWVSGVASSGTFVKPEALADTRGTAYIPYNWTVQNY